MSHDKVNTPLTPEEMNKLLSCAPDQCILVTLLRHSRYRAELAMVIKKFGHDKCVEIIKQIENFDSSNKTPIDWWPVITIIFIVMPFVIGLIACICGVVKSF